jgi:diguanylate cyclase (GGDEF)-like protein
MPAPMRSESESTSRRRGRGAPLWLYLAALVLIPLIGVIVLTATLVRTRMAEAASAERAEAAVRAVAALDAARSGVELEVIPVLSLAVIADPTIAASMGLGEFLGELQYRQVLTSVRETRAATDRALAQVPTGSVGAAAAAEASAELTILRAQADARELDLVDTYTTYLEISDELTAAQGRAAAAANSEAVPVRTLRATRDVQLVAQLTQAASRQMPLFLGSQLAQFSDVPHFSELAQFSQFDDSGTPIGLREAWEAAWSEYLEAKREMDELSQGTLRTAWDGLRSSSAMADVDGLLDRHAAGSSSEGMSILQLVMLVNQNAAREALMSDLLDSAVADAQALAGADRDQANKLRTTTLDLGIGLLFASVAAALLLGRRVSRSLSLLSGQATQVSEGSLVEVEVAGPREVRTVSTALGSAVASLRRIQDQAEAVAHGDLSNAVLNQPLPGPLGEVVHASVKQIVHSVRQREELQSALAHQAAHDALTDLPNRAQALTLVASALSRGQRSGVMTGLLFVDLDGFKGVNDSHGHACGDEVLREVAVRLRQAVRAGDVVCRLGGDEFVVVVEPVETERDLLHLAERIIAAISETITARGHEIHIGASVGVAVSRDAGSDPDSLFAEADAAAYRAKRNGRGRAEIFDDTLRRQLTEQAELEAAIAHGLANGEMRLHYQPVIDVTTAELRGYEALVRWQRPGHGMVSPDQFIPMAERSRLICDLDRWVLHEATRQLAEWRESNPVRTGTVEPTIAVNISGRHLADRRVLDDVTDALDASGLPAHLLILEVTETVLVDDPVAIGHLAALRDLGISIAIDDFGTGYTSIGQLRNMPVDTLKIDRSFIASTDPGHRELVALIIRAAHTFGLTVVAEGVEESSQLARLKAESCDQAQGFLLYRPMPPEDAGALLRLLAGADLTSA